MCDNRSRTSLTALSTSFRWVKDVTEIVSGTDGYTANLAGLTNSNMTLARAGFYELELTTAGCPVVVSDPVEVIVKQNVTFNDLDMMPKELLPGNTVSFTSRARNVEMTSTYTWLVDGNAFTAADMLPATIMVNGNTLNIVSIVNTPLPADATRTTSTITICWRRNPGASDRRG